MPRSGRRPRRARRPSRGVRRLLLAAPQVFERHPPLLLSPFPGPFTGLFTGRFPRRLFARLFQEPPRLPRPRFVHPRSSAPQRLIGLAARLEQLPAPLPAAPPPSPLAPAPH